MKREQAARVIDNLDFYMQQHANDYGERSHEAMMMAIESLKNENALIDRVLEIIEGHVESRFYPDGGADYVIENVEGLIDAVEALKGGDVE